jgi:chloride channel protein, CIC family
MISMAAILGGTMRSPLTGVIFALELTQDVQALLPLLIACVTGHAFTVLVLPRSILTEKVARRGYHLTREYTVDPLEALTVDEVMSRDPVTVPASMNAHELERRFFTPLGPHVHQGYPVLDGSGCLAGVVTRSNLIQLSLPEDLSGRTVGELITQTPVVCFRDETCRTAAERMADAGVGRLPVVAPEDPRRLVGIITRSDLLKARRRYLELEQRRERLLHAPWERVQKPPTGL